MTKIEKPEGQPYSERARPHIIIQPEPPEVRPWLNWAALFASTLSLADAISEFANISFAKAFVCALPISLVLMWAAVAWIRKHPGKGN